MSSERLIKQTVKIVNFDAVLLEKYELHKKKV